jgi:hypothetical protein
MKSIFGLGKVEKGKLTLKNQQIFQEELKGLVGEVVVTVAEGRGKRSDAQNRYYWGIVMKLISDTTGYTPEEVHEFLKEKFLTDKKHIVIGGEERDIEKATTTRLTTKEFEEYIENIRAFASMELQINVPSPNEPERVKDMLDEYLDLQQQ